MIVTVYTGPGCYKCEATKRELDKANIRYKEVNVADDPSAVNIVIGKGFNSLPVVVIAGSNYSDAWSNHRPTKIAELAEIC